MVYKLKFQGIETRLIHQSNDVINPIINPVQNFLQRIFKTKCNDLSLFLFLNWNKLVQISPMGLHFFNITVTWAMATGGGGMPSPHLFAKHWLFHAHKISFFLYFCQSIGACVTYFLSNKDFYHISLIKELILSFTFSLQQHIKAGWVVKNWRIFKAKGI